MGDKLNLTLLVISLTIVWQLASNGVTDGSRIKARARLSVGESVEECVEVGLEDGVVMKGQQ